MAKPAPRLLEVLRVENITPHMRRVVLGGNDFDDFPDHHESANFKLLMAPPGMAEVPLPPVAAGGVKPLVRTYTLRHFDRAAGEVWVDFMLHAAHGPASSWALNATPGDKVGFAGPGKPKFVDFSADWFLLAGDMSALPAIAANIERLPATARGYVVLDVLDDADRQALPFPAAMEVIWRVNKHPEAGAAGWVDRVTSLAWLEGSPTVWVAGETGAVRAIRRRLMAEHLIERDRFYTSGYWQIGLTEDRHQQVKRQEREQQTASAKRLGDLLLSRL